MTIEALTTLITQLGFPVAVCIACFWFIVRMHNTQREDLKELADAINANTACMQRLVDQFVEEGKSK